MPGLAGGGLPDAEQTINADARGYLEEIDKINAKNEQWIASNRKIKEDLDSLGRYIDNFERNLDRIAKSSGGRDLPFFDMSKIQNQLAQLDAQRKAIGDVSDEAWNQAIAQDNLIKKYENLGAAARKVTFEQDHLALALADATSEAADHADAIRVMAETHDVLAEASGRTAIRIHETHRAIKTLTEEINRSAEAAGRAEASMTRVYGTPAGYGAYAAAPPPDTGRLSEGTMRAIAADEAGRRYSSIIPGLLAGGGLGALGGLIAARGGGLGAAAGAIGGGIGAAGRALGPVFDMGGGPTAADTSRVVTGFIRKWYPTAHWAMMLTNELMATAGPALVAGGMGALTGVQGFEELIPRGKAVFNTSEALGDSLGKTTGQAWGLKTAYLQNAQDLANGMATQLAGAAVNIIKSPGTGGAFAQLGLNTDAMFSRFAATLTQDFQKGGLGSQLSNMVTGGTGFLQQFGQVGTNLGRTFLNLAPNLPGVGGDLLGLFSGGTRMLANTTGALGGMLGPILAGEAGMRWGPAIIGTAARGIGRAGRIPGLGFLGDAAAGTGLAGLLGGLGAPAIGAISAGGLLLSKGYTYQPPMQAAANQMLTQVGQQGLVAGIPMMISQMQRFARVPASDAQMSNFMQNIAGGMVHVDTKEGFFSQLWSGAKRVTHGFEQFARGAMGGDIMGGSGRFLGKPIASAYGGANQMFDPSGYQAAQFAINELSKSMVNSLNSGQQIDAQWKKLSGTTLGLGKAADVATMAQLQLGSAFYGTGKHAGQLSDQAKTMISNLYAGYAPMQMNTGQFGSAVAAQTAVAGLQHTQVQAVNSAFDQLGQLITGGAAGAANYFGLLGATPVSFKRGGLQYTAAPGMKAMAQALGSFTTPTGAAAWNRLTNQQTGLFPALGGQFDWLREAQTMGALSAGQTRGMASYEMAQLLPSLKGNPAALAILSSYAQQFGGPGFAPGASAKDMFRDLSRFFGRTGVGGKGYNQLMTLGAEGLAKISTDALQFSQQIGSGIVGGLAQQIYQYGGGLQNAFIGSVSKQGGRGYDLHALENYAKFMMGAGVPKQGVIDMARYAAQLGGGGTHLQSQISHQLGQLYAKLQVQADTASARAAINNLTHVTRQPKVSVKAEVAAAQAAINSIKGKNVPVSVRQQGAAAVQAAIDSIHGKNVTVVITTINRMITQAVGAGLINTTGGFSLAGGGGRRIMPGHASGYASGYRVPGYGGGDRHLALLEGGEAVVPKHLVGAIAPYLSAHSVPGFAGGGFVGQATYGQGAYWGLGSTMAMWNPAWYQQIVAARGGVPHISGPVHGGGPFAAHAAAISALTGSSGGGSSGNSTLSQLNAEIRKAWQTLDKLYAEKDKGGLSGAALANLNAQIKNFWKTVLDPLYAQKDALTGGRGGSSGSGSSSGFSAAQLAKVAKEFTIHLSGDIAKEIKGSTAAKNIATALISKLTQEVGYAKSVRSAMKQGLNLGGMDVTPGTGQGTVYEQMQSYSKSLSSFSGDLSKLGKGHLNKDLMKQIVAAGPVQGDALAQSILNDYGGIGAVNKQYAQITKQANKLGIKAAELQYGGHLSDNLRSGTVSSHGININVNLNKGATGDLELTPQQVAAIVAKVQAALLKQAKKNNKTGVKAHGKSA